MVITMRIDPDTLGIDSKYPEVFANFCEERLGLNDPEAEIDVRIGTGDDELPSSITGNELWEAYCSLPRAEYARLSAALPETRRAIYLASIEC